MNILKTAVLAIVLLTGVTTALVPASVGASPASQIQGGVNATTDTPASQPGLPATLKVVINTMLYILGALAVIMIVVGGIRYTTSSGDSSRVKAAKDTLTYSIVGLLVALFAYAIVNFVIDKLG